MIIRVRTILLTAGCIAMLARAETARAASLSKADEQFLTMAAKADMTEAHEGQIDENQASRTDVKEFAKSLIQDHTDSYQELSQLAAKTGVSIPKGIDTDKVQTIVQLVHLKGATFDRRFAEDEVAGHKHAIAAFRHEAEHAQDADVKAYAAKMVPILEKHLHLAEDCAKTAKRS